MLGRAGLVALALSAGCFGPLRSTDTVGAKAPVFGAPDNLPRDVARSISACWRPPHEGDEITLRMSFRRDGSVFGKPRITYMKAAGGADGEADLANSIMAAVAACTPVRFTPSLGAAIAGRVFLIRFVALRKEQRAALPTNWSSNLWPATP